MGYEALASAYDSFTRDVDYEALCSYIVTIFNNHGTSGGAVLDLACGTGTLSRLLAKAGFSVVGVDVSVEMLAAATAKNEDGAENSPVYVCQDMCELDLYSRVDACVCTLDAINHLVEPDDVRAVFNRLSIFLERGGLFVFDVNTPFKLNAMDGQAFIEEDDECFCAWSVVRTDEQDIFEFVIDLFMRDGNHWRRDGEVFCERAYSVELLTGLLNDAGFELLHIYGDRRFDAPAEDENRIFFVARKI